MVYLRDQRNFSGTEVYCVTVQEEYFTPWRYTSDVLPHVISNHVSTANIYYTLRHLDDTPYLFIFITQFTIVNTFTDSTYSADM